MIDIITYCDSHQQILKDFFFIPSFKIYLDKDFNHIDLVEDSNLHNCNEFGFGSNIFQYMIYNRWQILIDHIEQFPDKDRISIFSDIDIVFLGNFKTLIESLIFNNQINDIYFMPEIPELPNKYNFFNINAGFFMFKHTEKTLEFFRFILNFMKKQKIKEDQFYIQQHVKNNSINFIGLLNFNNFNTNNCSIHINRSLRDNGSLKVFHATSCLNINEKINVLFDISKPSHKKMLNFIR